MPQLLCVKLEDPKNFTSQALRRSRAVMHLVLHKCPRPVGTNSVNPLEDPGVVFFFGGGGRFGRGTQARVPQKKSMDLGHYFGERTNFTVEEKNN